MVAVAVNKAFTGFAFTRYAGFKTIRCSQAKDRCEVFVGKNIVCLTQGRKVPEWGIVLELFEKRRDSWGLLAFEMDSGT